MSDKTSSAIPSLTAREVELAILGWRALKTINMDWDKLAEVAGLKSGNSARTTFCSVKKKLLEGNVAATPKKTPKKRQEPEDAIDDDPTPTKKPRARAKKAAAPVAQPATVEDDDESRADETA